VCVWSCIAGSVVVFHLVLGVKFWLPCFICFSKLCMVEEHQNQFLVKMEKMLLKDTKCCSKFMERKKLEEHNNWKKLMGWHHLSVLKIAEELNLNIITFFKPKKTIYVKIMLKIFSDMQKIRCHTWDFPTRIHWRTWHFSKDTD
jgi:hypothetical protein